VKDILWTICKKIESAFGYNRTTEVICATLTFLTGGPSLWRLKRESTDLIIVTVWMPAYIDNISDVLLQLKIKGLKVAIFPEWQRKKEERYNDEMAKFEEYDIYYDAHRALPFINSRIFLSSTATKHYYFSKARRRFFYFHSVAGLAGFPEGGMDDYTDFLCATRQQLEELEARFKILGYCKTLHEAGYPKFDSISNRITKVHQSLGDKKPTISNVLLAPSYASDDVYADVSMLPHIEIITRSILNLGCNVTFRPHPVSLRRGRFVKSIRLLKDLFNSYPGFYFDESQDYFETYQNADVMITDVSGTSMMFSAAFKKPVIFFTPNPGVAMNAFNSINQIGPITDRIQSVVELLKNINTLSYSKAPVIFRMGRSVETFVSILKG
jgi:hypothetical protein